jgi:2-polyprenyl-3-methyl-5-hydroxy-6-metoxy-1,4-benzoquinol methylase
MSQKNSIFYNFLSSTYIYIILQKLMSATYVRKNFVKNHIKKGHNVIDVGSGPSSIISDLPEINYYGYDINRSHIEYAKKKYPNKNFHFFCKKFNKNEICKLPRFDCALLLGLVHHLNDKEFITIIRLIKSTLKKNGKILILDNVIVRNQNFISRFLIKNDKGDNIRSLDQYKLILNKYFSKIKYQVNNQAFIPYTWLKITCYK